MTDAGSRAILFFPARKGDSQRPEDFMSASTDKGSQGKPEGGKPEGGKPEATKRPETDESLPAEKLDKVTGGLNPQPLPPGRTKI
jgi:hypothetical protein